ncbi:MAG: methanol dehydrogenase [Desulfobulbus propionicus]|nr:MAG: methanol dehydrogenase [Desulfobulbus propionicus]
MVIIFLLFLLLPSSVLGLEVPPLRARVNDYAGILSKLTVSQLETMLATLEQTDSTQIAVLTIPSLKGDNLEQFSLRVVETWKLGQKNVDNGALLLISRDDRKIRIEVGYGLEGTLTDMISGQIIRNIIVPEFKKSNFDQGVANGVTAMIQVTRGEFTAPASTGSDDKPELGGLFLIAGSLFTYLGIMFKKRKVASVIIGALGLPLIGLLFFDFNIFLLGGFMLLGMIFPIFFSLFFSRSAIGTSSSSGFHSSGGFGGSSSGFGGFSGGGGSFGGGGASGGW